MNSTIFHHGTPKGFRTLILDDMVIRTYGFPMGLVLEIKTLIRGSHIEDLFMKNHDLFKDLG